MLHLCSMYYGWRRGVVVSGVGCMNEVRVGMHHISPNLPVPAASRSCEAAARWHRMSDICLRRWRVTPMELKMEPGPATPAVRRRVQRERVELRRRRRLPVVASDRPSCRRAFSCCERPHSSTGLLYITCFAINSYINPFETCSA